MASLSGWTETAMFLALFFAALMLVVGGFNFLYDGDNDATFGFSGDSIIDDTTGLEKSMGTAIAEGEASTDAVNGLSFTRTWDMIKTASTVVGSLLTGGWIENAVSLARLPAIMGKILRILFVLSLLFIVIKIFMKVKP